jgi:hypothetical protein
VLAHARKEDDKQKLQALAFVGDCVEEEPDLCAIADEHGKRDVRLFPGRRETIATNVFLEIARRTKGAPCQFDPSSAGELAELLRARIGTPLAD